MSSSCPIELNPPTAVVRFGDPFSANCSTSSNQTEGMGWESPVGGVALTNFVSSLPFKIDSVREWVVDSKCFVNLLNGDQCSQPLPLTVYKMPDRVSMSPPSQMGPMAEGAKYSVQCDIVNVAPARNLSVHWHKGKEILYTETFNESGKYPVNKLSVLNLTAHRDDNGTHIWCEAKLNIWPTGPRLPSVQSESHEVIVFYPPTFTQPANETLELPAGGKIILNCTATGNPMPVYSWHFPHPIQLTSKDQTTNQSILTPSIQLPGTYNCTVSNAQGTNTKYFTVIEAKRNRTTFAALVGVFVFLGALLVIGGLYFVTPEGTFSFSKGSYIRGQPTSSGPV